MRFGARRGNGLLPQYAFAKIQAWYHISFFSLPTDRAFRDFPISGPMGRGTMAVWNLCSGARMAFTPGATLGFFGAIRQVQVARLSTRLAKQDSRLLVYEQVKSARCFSFKISDWIPSKCERRRSMMWILQRARAGCFFVSRTGSFSLT